MSKKNAKKPATSPEKPKPKPKAEQKPKPKSAKKSTAGSTSKAQGSTVTKETAAEKAKRIFSRRRNIGYVGIVVIAILAISGFSIWAYSLTIGNISGTPSPVIRANLVNGMDFTNMTKNYSAQAFVVDSNQPLNNATFQFYKSWMLGVNGSAADLRLKIGDQFNSKAINGFVIRFLTNVSGYGNFSDFSVYVIKNIVFNVNVYKDPTIVNNSASAAGTTADFELQFRLSNSSDSAFAPTWHPRLYNVSMSYFYINFTFEHIINMTEFNHGVVNVTSVISDPYDSIGTGYQNIVRLPNPLSNGNKSFSLMLWLANGKHDYQLSAVSSLGNITSISFNYGPSKIKTIGLHP